MVAKKMQQLSVAVVVVVLVVVDQGWETVLLLVRWQWWWRSGCVDNDGGAFEEAAAVVCWEAEENYNVLTAVSVIDGDAGFKTSCHASIMYSDVKSAERLLDLNHSRILFAHVGACWVGDYSKVRWCTGCSAPKPAW
jgi:hypothetical protein